MSDSLNKFDEVSFHLREMFIDKNALYGDSAFYIGHTIKFPYWLRLSDVLRKTARLESLTEKAIHDDKEAQKKLIDDYKDLAIYAIIAVAVLEEQE